MLSFLFSDVYITIFTLLILFDQSINIAQAGNCFHLRTNDLCYDLSEMNVNEEQCTGSYYSDDTLQELDGYVYAENCRDINISPKQCEAKCGLGRQCQWIDGEEMCVCSPESCLSIKNDQQPLCASNNMTFNSECEMKAWMCTNERSGLYKKYDGPCQKDCRNVKCPHNTVCSLIKNTGEPMCYPKTHCNPTLNPEPVCGTNGLTYPNICIMRLSTDRRGRTPELAHKGSCKSECQSDLCGLGERCVISKRSRPVCIQCQFPQRFLTHNGECSINIPVCGTNGYLYKNYCFLLLDQCEKNQYINIVDYGSCPISKRKNIFPNKLNYLKKFTSF